MDTPRLMWLADVAAKTWADYECPVCRGIERVSSLTDKPIMHRHRYGTDPLQTGMVMLRKIETAK